MQSAFLTVCEAQCCSNFSTWKSRRISEGLWKEAYDKNCFFQRLLLSSRACENSSFSQKVIKFITRVTTPCDKLYASCISRLMWRRCVRIKVHRALTKKKLILPKFVLFSSSWAHGSMQAWDGVEAALSCDDIGVLLHNELAMHGENLKALMTCHSLAEIG